MFKNEMTLLPDALKKKYLPAIETFPNPIAAKTGKNSVVKIIFPEFTCVCPKTGYPDFASIDLYYLPTSKCIELKSWKLYLNSFRMIGTFHETVSEHLFTTVHMLIKPKWLLLVGDFFPRGNVNTTIVIEAGNRPSCADFAVKKYSSHTRDFN